MSGSLLDGKLQAKGTWKDKYAECECTFVDDVRIGTRKLQRSRFFRLTIIFIEIARGKDGHLLIYEMCGKLHGKYTLYYANGKVVNEVNREGTKIASKQVLATEAYFTKSGQIQTAASAEWKTLT